MITYNNIRFIGVDHGYGNIKTANTVTPTGIIVTDTEPTFKNKLLFYRNRYYNFGEGHKDFISDKTADDEYYAATLMGIGEELRLEGITEADVHICAGLPLTWVSSQREDFRSYLTQHEEVIFTYRDKSYHIRIVGCTVSPQGYSAILEHIKDMNGLSMVADIGNGTINVMYMNDKTPVSSRCYTEKMGVEQCVIAAQNDVMDKYGVLIDRTVIETFLRTGNANVSQKYFLCLQDSAIRYADKIMAVLNKYEYNPELMKLYVCGGGVSIMKHFSEVGEQGAVFIDDICTGAKGYERIAVKLARRDGI